MLIPPLLYVIYAGIGYLRGWDFAGRQPYPYFFLNWGSAAGAFGFTKELPYMGCVWWILILLAFLIAVGWCYVALPVLVIGDESEAVRAAQTLLEKRGFKCGWMGCDGEFGPKTEAALGKFKRDRDLERNPEIDAETWQRLICG